MTEGTDGPDEPTTPPPPPPGFEPPPHGAYPPMVSQIEDIEPPAKSPRKTLWWVGGIGAALLVLLVGGVTWGVINFLRPSGAPVTAALPDSTVAFAAVDLDPSTSQKLSALEFLRKFPGITDHVSFDPKTTDDLRQWLTSTIANDPTCSNFDFDTQIAPWLGKRAAVAGAPNSDGTMTVFGVIQVTDQQKAKDAIANNFGCDPDPSSPPPAVATDGDYIVLAEKQADADYFAQQAEASPLTDDADYQAEMAKLGDSGIAMAYVSPAAVTQLQDQIDQAMAADGLGSSYTDNLQKALDSFQGAAAVLRFDGGSLELKSVMSIDMSSLSGDSTTTASSSSAAPAIAPVADLPASTIFAVGAGYRPGSASGGVNSYWDQLMQSDPLYESDLRAIEQDTGLSLPDDLVTLFGNGYAFAVDSSLDPNVFTSQSMPDGSQLPMGVRFVGDADAISGVLEKIAGYASTFGIPLSVEKGDGVVGFSFSDDYAKQLAGSGGLGASASYQAAVQSTGDPNQVMYVDLGAARDWIQTLDTGDPSVSDILDNMAPLDALGMASYTDGQDAYMEMRLTTH